MSFNTFIRHHSQRVGQLLNYLLPPTCVLCSQLTHTSALICRGCECDLPILSHHCRQCAHVLGLGDIVCGACLLDSPPFSRTHALFTYEAPIISLVTGLKFQRQLSHARLLAELLLHKINSQWYLDQCLPDVLLPVPLHLNRLRERGFNQALEIAKPIAKACQMALDVYGVSRVKETLAQSGLSAKERQTNMAGAFRANVSYQGKTVVILDDVVTTGQTVQALADVLKLAGAKDIHVWCVARTGVSSRKVP